MPKHLLSLDDLSAQEIKEIVCRADDFARGAVANLEQKVIANLFFEPSTRTQYSFEMAQKNWESRRLRLTSRHQVLIKVRLYMIR